MFWHAMGPAGSVASSVVWGKHCKGAQPPPESRKVCGMLLESPDFGILINFCGSGEGA